MFTEMCFRFVIYDAYKKELKAREEAAAKDTKKSAPAAESEPARKVSLKDWIKSIRPISSFCRVSTDYGYDH